MSDISPPPAEPGPLAADRSRREPGYDVIGDVHGCAQALAELLTKMGYAERDGAFTHATRQVVFVGDLIDRGPEQIATVTIARAMVEAGSALIVAGNHEFNAVAYATPDPTSPGAYLRRHSDKNKHQHERFLAEAPFGGAQHREVIGWFMELPLWLELDGLRVVHACWDPAAIATVGDLVGPANYLTPDLVEKASSRDSAEWEAIEHLLKGPEIPVPSPYRDKDGHRRTFARLRWWDPDADTLATGALIPPQTKTETDEDYPPLPGTPIEQPPVEPYRSEIPLLYGHYWQSGTPTLSSPKTACLDYSAVKGGSLVAYRWSGEADLSAENFVSVDGRPT